MKKYNALMTALLSSLLLSLLFIGFVVPAKAQLYAGSVTGIIKDFSGAVWIRTSPWISPCRWAPARKP